MFRDVILPDATAEQWQQQIRPGILRKIEATMGEKPADLPGFNVEYLGDETVAGLTTRRLRFEAVPGTVTHGRLVLPADDAAGTPQPGMLCMHGTDYALAHENQVSPDKKPKRAYAIEMAKRGYVTLAVDALGFGEGNAGREPRAVYEAFYEQFPQWSIDGARLHIHQHALDVLTSLEAVDGNRLCCMGHSLGGRSAVYLAALDERIGAAVGSAGVSPNLTNVFRNLLGPEALSPRLNEETLKAGRPPFEYQEMLALVAPRMLILVEPWDDNCNPMVDPTIRCFEKARWVYKTLGAGDRLHLLCHGDGHDTQPEIRSFAYQMMDRVMQPGGVAMQGA